MPASRPPSPMPVSKSTTSAPVSTSVGVKLLAKASAGRKFSVSSAPTASADWLTPKVSLGAPEGRMPSRTVSTRKLPSLKLRISRGLTRISVASLSDWAKTAARFSTSGAANVLTPAARNKDLREIVEWSPMGLSLFVKSCTAVLEAGIDVTMTCVDLGRCHDPGTPHHGLVMFEVNPHDLTDSNEGRRRRAGPRAIFCFAVPDAKPLHTFAGTAPGPPTPIA